MIELFVTGMFRSGTTLLARALNAHRAISLASDPLFELLKALRSEEARELGQEIPVIAPLRDYYFDRSGLVLHRRLQRQTTLDRKFGIWSRAELLASLRERCATYSSLLAPRLDRMRGPNYRQMLDSLLEQIRNVYGDEGTSVVGFKEVWATEIVPALARTYAQMRFVLVVRDPRAVCASKALQTERYPLTFLTRQWRKLAALSWVYMNDPQLRGRALVVRYEDFISEPERVGMLICDLLGVAWDPSVIDPERYRDGGGRQWRQNTSYGEGKIALDSDALGRWNRVLSEAEVEFIEMMCGPEMGLFRYERTLPESPVSARYLVEPPVLPDDRLADWMRGVVPADALSTSLELAHETIRRSLLEADSKAREAADTVIVEGAFLDRRVMDAIASS